MYSRTQQFPTLLVTVLDVLFPIHRSPIFTNSSLLEGGEGKEVEKPCQVINWFLRNWISSGDELHSDDEFLDDSEVDDFIPPSPSNV